MERHEVYNIIDGERQYQKDRGMPQERTYKEWMDSIYFYMTASNIDEVERNKSIRKIAALAVAALEQYGCEPRAGYETPTNIVEGDWVVFEQKDRVPLVKKVSGNLVLGDYFHTVTVDQYIELGWNVTPVAVLRKEDAKIADESSTSI